MSLLCTSHTDWSHTHKPHTFLLCTSHADWSHTHKPHIVKCSCCVLIWTDPTHILAVYFSYELIPQSTHINHTHSCCVQVSQTDWSHTHKPHMFLLFMCVGSVYELIPHTETIHIPAVYLSDWSHTHKWHTFMLCTSQSHTDWSHTEVTKSDMSLLYFTVLIQTVPTQKSLNQSCSQS